MLQWMTRPLTTTDRSASVSRKIVKGIEVKRKGGLDLSAAAAHLFDRHRLKNHHLTVKVAEDLDALRVPFIGRRHPAGL